MITINLKEHTLYDAEAEPSFGIDYAGAGAVFIKADMTEPLQYCEALDREEVQDFFNKPDEYFFGKVSLTLEFTQSPTMGRGKQSMWFAKYFKSGYYEEPFE
ncbi:MAG: hypothetical protein L3J43_03685 [Sulfurovum sp.]|nr:hypothetical protein [Sulfurovum sp.]